MLEFRGAGRRARRREGEGQALEVVYERCCGLDVHKKEVVACTITPEGKEIRSFGTMTADLLALGDWLQAKGCTHVAMESTGVYWKPIYNLLEGQDFTLLVVNAQHIKAVPGRKTDVKDAEWIADLLRHGLLRGSFISVPCTIASSMARPDWPNTSEATMGAKLQAFLRNEVGIAPAVQEPMLPDRMSLRARFCPRVSVLASGQNAAGGHACGQRAQPLAADPLPAAGARRHHLDDGRREPAASPRPTPDL